MHPKTSGESEFLFATRLKHEFVRAVGANVTAVNEIIIIVGETKISYWTHEVFSKKRDVIVIYIHLLIQVAHKLCDAGVFDARTTNSLDLLYFAIRVFADKHIGKRFGNKDWQISFSVYGGGVHKIENKAKLF